MNNKIKITVIIFSLIITSVMLVDLLNNNLEPINAETMQKASEYNSRIYFENAFTKEQTCYGVNDDGSEIPLVCDVSIHSPIKFNSDYGITNYEPTLGKDLS